VLDGLELEALGKRNAKCQNPNDKAPKAQAEGIRHKAQGPHFLLSGFCLLTTNF